MNLTGQTYFLKNPTAASVVAGLDPGEINILTETGTIKIFGQANMTACDLICATPCVPGTWTVTIPDVAFGTCNPCPIKVGFQPTFVRPELYDAANYLDLVTRESIYYPNSLSVGNVTGTTIAAWFVQTLNYQSAMYAHDHYHVVATAVGNVLTLTFPCPLVVAIYDKSVGTALTLVETVSSISAKYTADQMHQTFSYMTETVPGAGLDISYFCTCESVCVLDLKGCYTGCSTTDLFKDNFIPLIGDAAGHRVDYVLFIDSNAPGYAAFIAAIKAALTTACAALQPLQGNSAPFLSNTVAAWAVGLNTVVAGFKYPGTYTISKTIVATGNTVSATLTNVTSLANLAVQATAALGATFTAATPNLVIAGAFVAGAGVVTVKQE